MSLGQLLPEKLGLVIEELFEVSIKWYTMGLMLGLSYSTLDNIKHVHEEQDCFREMLKAWFRRDQSCTWQALVSALQASAIGEHGIANKLEKKFLSVGKANSGVKLVSIRVNIMCSSTNRDSLEFKDQY